KFRKNEIEVVLEWYPVVLGQFHVYLRWSGRAQRSPRRETKILCRHCLDSPVILVHLGMDLSNDSSQKCRQVSFFADRSGSGKGNRGSRRLLVLLLAYQLKTAHLMAKSSR